MVVRGIKSVTPEQNQTGWQPSDYFTTRLTDWGSFPYPMSVEQEMQRLRQLHADKTTAQ